MWQEEALNLFFNQHKKISEIGQTLGKTRKTISVFLSSKEGFKEEKDRRKTENKEKRKQDKEEYEKTKRNTGSLGPYEKSILKRQHEIDVRVLSADKY